jgi:hypothetical protein
MQSRCSNVFRLSGNYSATYTRENEIAHKENSYLFVLYVGWYLCVDMNNKEGLLCLTISQTKFTEKYTFDYILSAAKSKRKWQRKEKREYM